MLVSGRAKAPVMVVGAGIGGLVAALLLSARGVPVTVVEKEPQAGGKLRTLSAGGAPVDSGPTVFTMRWVFEKILAACGERLEDHLTLEPAEVLARHHWRDGTVFDLHADIKRSANAIAALAGRTEAEGFLAFCRRAAETFRTLEKPYLEKPAPTPLTLARDGGLFGLVGLARIGAYAKLWDVIATYFRDPRLQQLFGRYATYCGSSPFQAPGPLTIVAHVEQRGVWLVEGGMQRVALMLEKLARARGAEFRFDTEASEILCRGGRAAGVRLADGEVLPASAVVFNGDPGALFSGLLGAAAKRAVAPWGPEKRSLSALTWSMTAQAQGFPLSRHTVFFGDQYRAEFDAIFREGRLPADPTIYVCAQDRDASLSEAAPQGPERLFLLVNAPPWGDAEKTLSPEEIETCRNAVTARLSRAGLTIFTAPGAIRETTPAEFSRLFPGSGGALYGRAAHGWQASFQRPLSRTAIPGLFLAGGAAHPGPGVPMAALSGSFAADAVIVDGGSPSRFRPAAMPGGTSTRPATTASTR